MVFQVETGIVSLKKKMQQISPIPKCPHAYLELLKRSDGKIASGSSIPNQNNIHIVTPPLTRPIHQE